MDVLGCREHGGAGANCCQAACCCCIFQQSLQAPRPAEPGGRSAQRHATKVGEVVVRQLGGDIACPPGVQAQQLAQERLVASPHRLCQTRPPRGLLSTG